MYQVINAEEWYVVSSWQTFPAACLDCVSLNIDHKGHRYYVVRNDRTGEVYRVEPSLTAAYDWRPGRRAP